MLPLPALNYMSRRNAVKADQLSIDVWSGIRFGTIRGFKKSWTARSRWRRGALTPLNRQNEMKERPEGQAVSRISL